MDAEEFINKFNQLCQNNGIKDYTVRLVPVEEIYVQMQGQYLRETRTFKFDKAIVSYYPWEINIYIALHEMAHAMQKIKYRNPHNIFWKGTFILLKIRYGLRLINPKGWNTNY